MIITDEQTELLNKYNISVSDDVNELLLELDDVITEFGFDSDYELTDEGLKLQLVYDQIYNQN